MHECTNAWMNERLTNWMNALMNFTWDGKLKAGPTDAHQMKN